MSRTRGHDVDRYAGHKLWLAAKRDRKHGARRSVRVALRKITRGQGR